LSGIHEHLERGLIEAAPQRSCRDAVSMDPGLSLRENRDDSGGPKEPRSKISQPDLYAAYA
jgi:hypothetical protein